jgi:nicotinate-nucleotide adenylyltransferase
MGGTFDPIHHGHLVAASEVQALFDLDEVVFVPTGQPWQKAGREVAAAEHRYLMTVVATAIEPPVHRLARGHRPRRPDLHHRHAA